MDILPENLKSIGRELYISDLFQSRCQLWFPRTHFSVIFVRYILCTIFKRITYSTFNKIFPFMLCQFLPQDLHQYEIDWGEESCHKESWLTSTYQLDSKSWFICHSIFSLICPSNGQLMSSSPDHQSAALDRIFQHCKTETRQNVNERCFLYRFCLAFSLGHCAVLTCLFTYQTISHHLKNVSR